MLRMTMRVTACIAFSLAIGAVIYAQVPGVCTSPTGSPWSGQAEFDREATSPATIASGLSTTRGFNNPYRLPTAEPQSVRRWLQNGQPVDREGSIPEVTNQQPAVVNRYAPHSIPTPHSNSKSQENASASVPIYNSSFRRNAQDDLLAPTPNANSANADSANDLLGTGQPSNSGDALSQMGPDAQRERERAATKTGEAGKQAAVDPHWEVFANDKYPSAIKCSKCHQKIYDEWRVSSHAYAAVSPMFHRFEQKVAELTRGTSGTFCLRCHAPVATQADFPRDASIFNGPIVFREGITCIACHRVIERYGRVNGERRIELGSEYDPIVGNIGGDGIQAVIADRDNFKVKIDPNDTRPLQPIHQGAIQFEQLSDSSFCAGCHQVVVQPGIALEIVYQQYRQGPACKKGVSCQDCHMGAVPGKPLGYTYGAAAEISGKTINTQRKHSNHVFYGPAYPIAHPGIFPHNEKSLRWTADQWLQFDHRQGWGTDRFETLLTRGQIAVSFPPAWQIAQERRDARKIIDENEKLIAYKKQTAHEVLENGSRIDGPFFASPPRTGEDLKFSFIVSNSSEGHNMPSGSLGAQPQLWLNVVLIGPNGNHLWESGHLDSNGDMCDLHSLDVRAGKVKRDAQLANFQTKFLITNVKGTEREMYLPVNVDIDPLPFFRPGTVPYTVLNHPPFVRMEAHSIGPLDSRTSRYSIPSELIRMPGIYRLSVRLRSRIEPPYFLLFCEGTPDMLTALNEGIINVHPYSTEFVVR